MKIKGLKKAVGDYNNWIKRNFGYYAQIMLDRETGEIWCDCFTSINQFIKYKSDAIVSISYFMEHYGLIENVSMKNVKLTIIKAMEDGYIPIFEVNYKGE